MSNSPTQPSTAKVCGDCQQQLTPFGIQQEDGPARWMWCKQHGLRYTGQPVKPQDKPVVSTDAMVLMQQVNRRVIGAANPCPSREEWDQLQQMVADLTGQ